MNKRQKEYKKRLFENSHCSRCKKQQENSSMKVTDEHIHDSKTVPELVQNIIKSNSATASKLFADYGAYYSNGISTCLKDNGILPCIKVRNNAKVRWKKGNILRNLSVLAQRNNLQRWKKDSASYELR